MKTYQCRTIVPNCSEQLRATVLHSAGKLLSAARLKIEGMTCEGCATTVAQAIKGVSGVSAVTVNYEQKQATVGTDACCPVPRDEILKVLAESGYVGHIQ